MQEGIFHCLPALQTPMPTFHLSMGSLISASGNTLMFKFNQAHSLAVHM